jgi:CRP-like cAMP-binding protein
MHMHMDMHTHMPHAHALAHMHASHASRALQVRYERDGASRELRYCDYFGEVSILTQTSHLATVTATSRVEMVEVSRDSFTHLLTTRPRLRERVMRRSRLRYTASWRAIGANSVFTTFSMAQARH